jgi:hypothetical protein
MSKRGVLIIALGNSYYGQLAANLAASLKFTAPNIPIHLVWAEDALTHLSEQKKGLFDSTQECPHEYFHVDRGGVERKSYVKAKTHMYDLSPFEETIFIDADVIMCPYLTVDKMFDQLAHLDFTMENRSRVNLAEIQPGADYLWADIQDIKKTFKISQGFLYGLHSEFVYFKRNQTVRKFFTSVKKYFKDPKVKMTHVFDGDIPDEFAFAMAMIEHGLYPHECPFIPLYWFLTDRGKGTSMQYVHANYSGYSVGGNQTPQSVIQNYNSMARAYFQRLGVQHPFRLIRKRSVLPSRAKM